MSLRNLAAAALMLLALTGCAGSVASPAADAPAAAPAALGRGVNVLGYDPIWSDPAKARFQEHHFRDIRAGGFDFVRVNLQAFRHMDAADRLDPRWLERLDWVVRGAQAAGLGVILDEHDFNPCSEDVERCRTKLSAFWRQVAPRYRDAPANVMFELLNEPHDKLDAPTWNRLAAELLALVRESNPTRTVIIGPTQWNSLEKIETLELPEPDRNIVVTFHYYEPFRFTHQGASWVPDFTALRGVIWGSEEDKARLRADFARVAQWARAHRRPVLLGEFGAYDRSGTPLAMRAAYTAAVAREAEANGFGWAYWQFDSDFIVWDMAKGGWVQPIKDALVPPGR